MDLCWTSTGPLLDLDWTSTGPLLDLDWTSTGPLLDLYWTSTGPLLDLHWTSYWASYWASTELRLDLYMYWASAGPLLGRSLIRRQPSDLQDPRTLDLCWASTGPPNKPGLHQLYARTIRILPWPTISSRRTPRERYPRPVPLRTWLALKSTHVATKHPTQPKRREAEITDR